MKETTNITLRLDDELIERIDRAALQAGQSRTAYVVSWLPVSYDSTAETETEQAEQHRR